jgi:phosphoserine phosphatase
MASTLSPTAPITRFTATVFHKLRSSREYLGTEKHSTHGPNASSISHETILALESALHALFSQFTSTYRWLDSAETRQIVEISILFTTPIAPSHLRRAESILLVEQEHNIEIVFQADNVFRRHKRLAVFDMDSTLIQQEVIDEIARKLGVEDKVSAITERAMNGELDFTESLRARCALLKGVSSTVFEELRSVISLTPGAQDLVRVLKRLGYKTAVLSGGFTPLTSWQAQQLGLDYAFANHLVVSADGLTLTGEVTGEIVNAEKKREHLIDIAAKEGIILEQVLAVGDGANDLPMMGVAGLGVAFNAKPRVQLEAPAKLNSPSLLDILYLLGFTRQEQDELLATCDAV